MASTARTRGGSGERGAGSGPGGTRAKEGDAVYDASGRLVGEVEEVQDGGLRVNGQLVPVGEIAAADEGGVRLAGESVPAGDGEREMPQRASGRRGAQRARGAEVVAPSHERTEIRRPDAEDEIRVPVVEERLRVEKETRTKGEVVIQTHTEEREARVPVSLLREAVEVERVPVNRPLDEPPTTRREGEWLVVPVVEEEVVVQKRLVLREEVRIRTIRQTEESEIREPVRRQRVEVVDTTQEAEGGSRDATRG